MSRCWGLFSFIFTILWSHSGGYTVYQGNCLTEVAETNKLYSRDISRDNTYIYVFKIDLWRLGDPQNINLRVEANVGYKVTLECPIIFAVGQQQRLTALELPFVYNKNRTNVYYEAARTLCVTELDYHEIRNVTVRVSTCSKEPVNYSLQVSVQQNYLIPLNQDIQIRVSPTTPVVRGFLFDRHVDLSSVKISATSSDITCMTISVQPFECPVFYEEFNVQYRGLWQTMTQKAAMTIEQIATGRFKQGFALALVVHDNDDRCHKSTQTIARLKSPIRQKIVQIRVSSDSELTTWKLILCLGIPVFVSLLLVLLTTCLFRWRHQRIQEQVLQDDVTGNLALHKKPVNRESVSADETLSLHSLDGNQGGNGDNTDSGLHRSSQETVAAKSLVSGREQIRRYPDVYLQDFSRGQAGSVERKARRFCWALITVAIFYAIPVYQLIFHYLGVLYKTGEYDLCYYNYLCAHRIGFLLDFNHFFSNIGYVIFGCAFIWIVRRRDANLKASDDSCDNNNGRRRLSRPKSTLQVDVEAEEENRGRCGSGLCFFRIEMKPAYGVPQHFGVFYSLGLALIMEGFLSAAYHVCPNQNNFQFDTCFMYVISVLTILKIYQFRHPVALDAHQTFGILAGVVLVSVGGLLLEYGGSSSTFLYVFRICFITGQFILLIIISVYIYTVGYVKDEAQVVATDLRLMERVRRAKTKPIQVDRLIQPLMSIFVCTAVVIYTELNQIDFGTYLLYTFVGNVLVSVLYYVVIMKPLSGEYKNGMWMQPTLYFVSCGIVGGFAMYYFVQSPAQWEKSAAESRSENNIACMNSWFPFQPFYDVHDVWHFLSAIALFLAFMGLLTVDDDLISTPQSRIPVF